MHPSPEPELPECPVCLQPYAYETIPRVLSCGHTACETCLSNLPRPFPDTARCPACAQLVRLPSTGPSSLPKNIDLLRFYHAEDTNRDGAIHGGDCPIGRFPPLVPKTWSDELLATWKGWILPYGAVFLKDHEGGVGDESVRVGRIVFSFDGDGDDNELMLSLSCVRLQFRDHIDVKVCAIPVASGVSERVGGGSGFTYGYLSWIMRCLTEMKDHDRKELGLLLRVCSDRFVRVHGAEYGLWGDVEAGVLYMVGGMNHKGTSDVLADLPNGFSSEDSCINGFALVALDICESLIGLNAEGVVAGLLGIQCINTDGFGRAYIDLSKMLTVGRKIFAKVGEFIPGGIVNDSNCSSVIFRELLEDDIFLSPEVLFEVLKREGARLDGIGVSVPVSCGTDVWVLGCILIRLLVGDVFPGETFSQYKEEDADDLSWYMKWLEKVAALLEARSLPTLLKQLVLQSLKLDSGSRPNITQLWRCIRDLIYKNLGTEMEEINASADFHCLILGKICQIARKKAEILTEEPQHKEVDCEVDLQVRELISENLAYGLLEEKVNCKDLLAHRDCITGLAVGGGFLFSSSFDKTVQVWSLQDFTHLHTFKGHEHKIMAIIYMDWEQNCCVTGDSGGGIFVWDVCPPLMEDPVKKWYEAMDWRYSGIHSLACANNGYLYTGGGDKIIKAWSLQDSNLVHRLGGHKAVVSSLVVSNGVLYSGSWDGTVRLWGLSDHSPLTVLGDDILGKAPSVLSLVAHRDVLVVAYENGNIKVWRKDRLVNSVQLHKGTVFAVSVEGKWVMSGGWDKTITIQELSGEGCFSEIRTLGSISCSSVVTALLSWQGKLIAGCADKSVKKFLPYRMCQELLPLSDFMCPESYIILRRDYIGLLWYSGYGKGCSFIEARVLLHPNIMQYTNVRRSI